MKPVESFIEQPIRSLQTMLRTIQLDQEQSSNVIPDGIFGQSTALAVSDFQRRNALPVTGIADADTWDQIVEAYEDARIRIDEAEPIEIILEPGEIFSLGSTGPYIYLLQSMLIFLSDIHSTIHPAVHTGQYDEDTRLAVLDLQRLSNLPQTGQTDRQTWKHLSRQFTLNAHHNRLYHN